jgi:hypothetical protein
MPTVDIEGNTYEVYADVDEADAYLEAAMHADAWRAEEDEDVKARALVSATRTLERQRWKGDKLETSPEQTLSWPRTNTGIDGVSDTEVPDNIINASIEMANALVGGYDLQSEQNTSQKIQSLQAGSVSLSYFRGAEGDVLRFPLIITELLSGYLAGSDTIVGGGVADGTDGVSVTENDFGMSGPL